MEQSTVTEAAPVQVQNSLFDVVTMRKVIKGLLFSLLGGLSAFITAYTQFGDAKKSALIALAVVLAPFSANTAMEYRSGVPQE